MPIADIGLSPSMVVGMLIVGATIAALAAIAIAAVVVAVVGPRTRSAAVLPALGVWLAVMLILSSNRVVLTDPRWVLAAAGVGAAIAVIQRLAQRELRVHASLWQVVFVVGGALAGIAGGAVAGAAISASSGTLATAVGAATIGGVIGGLIGWRHRRDMEPDAAAVMSPPGVPAGVDEP